MTSLPDGSIVFRCIKPSWKDKTSGRLLAAAFRPRVHLREEKLSTDRMAALGAYEKNIGVASLEATGIRSIDGLDAIDDPEPHDPLHASIVDGRQNWTSPDEGRLEFVAGELVKMAVYPASAPSRSPDTLEPLN